MKIAVLRGANLWANVPVLEIAFGDPFDAPTLRRLGSLILEHQRICGGDVRFSDLVEHPSDGRPRLVVEYEEEAVARAALDLALAAARAEIAGQPVDRAAGLAGLIALGHDVRLGPSTGAIVRAARARGIPVRRLNTESLVVLGQGSKQRRICTAETDRTSAIAESVAQDKELTRSLLRAVGVAVPEGRVVRCPGDAWRAARELGLPVVVKPRDGNHGRGVTTNLSTQAQVERAYAAARAVSEDVLVEQHIRGDDYRLLVVGDRLVAASRREPAHVIGDGRSTVKALMDEVNKDPRRSDGHATSLSYLKLDPVSLAVLADQGLTPDSVPAAGQRVLIRRNANLSTGGTATDVTDDVHPDIAAAAVAAARVVGLDIAGVDLLATDVRQTMEEQQAAVVEVNAGPGLRMHLDPSAGKPRPVGEAVVGLLFPEGESGRIPLVAVTGGDGRAAVARLAAHLLREAGHVVGLACADGLSIDGRRIARRDGSGPDGARDVLINPVVTAAVLETSPAGVVREGLGFDRCDVAVVTGIGKGDHASPPGPEALPGLVRANQVVVESVSPDGVAVLNADDPLASGLASRCKGRVLHFTSRQGGEARHSLPSTGQSLLSLRDNELVLGQGGLETAILSLDRGTMSCEGHACAAVVHVLAAVGAALALGLSLDVIREGLRSFRGDGQEPAGRGCN